MKNLLEYIVCQLVDNTEAVKIRERKNRSNITYELTVDSHETGKVIGRNGRIAKSIRDVMSIAAARQGKRVYVDIK